MRTAGETERAAQWAAGFDHWEQGFVDDPYPSYRRLRESCPIAHSDVYGGFWVLSRYRDVVDVCHRPETFSSNYLSIPTDIGAGDMPVPPINVDPPDHARYKKLLLPAFGPRQMARFEEPIRSVARGLVNSLSGRGTFDISKEFAQQLPILVTAHLLGTPAKDGPMVSELLSWSLEGGATDHDSAAAAVAELTGYLSTLMKARAEDPRDDLISLVVQADADMDWTTRLGMMYLLLVAGIDTTWGALGTTLWYLAQHPEVRQQLTDDPSLLPTAVEEFLRVFAPTTVARTATEDTVVGGHPIAAGDRVLVPFPSANRDEDEFPDSDEVRIDRQPNRHLAFGVGIHRCLGSAVARMEMQFALEELLAELTSLAQLDETLVSWKPGPIRAIRTLPVRATWREPTKNKEVTG
jgi:cytochrome P450